MNPWSTTGMYTQMGQPWYQPQTNPICEHMVRKMCTVKPEYQQYGQQTNYGQYPYGQQQQWRQQQMIQQMLQQQTEQPFEQTDTTTSI